MRNLRKAGAALGALALACAAATGCNGSSEIGSVGGHDGGSSNGGGGGTDVSAPRKVDKVDILLGIDNSASMADKQQVLALAMADMIGNLTSPPCFDSSGSLVGPSHHGSCDDGTHTRYAAVDDIHVGIVSSSLGGHGSQSCSVKDGGAANNDAAHLIDRGPNGTRVATYKNAGFLAWDPKGQLSPPGDNDVSAFTAKIRDIVTGVGQDGCGYESQLESWYRFLNDPNPYTDIKLQNASVVATGTDETLLTQRADFLRPDSLLVVMMLSDENDCSVQESGFNPIMGNTCADADCNSQYYLPKARAICATDPDNACCGSCGLGSIPGCPDDPTCKHGTATLDAETDPVNLRCFDQKRRFGIDFLYPTSRYVSALTDDTVTDRDGQTRPNPIFSYLAGQDHSLPIRDPGLVVLASISGVPWQDIARDPNDLTKGFKSETELNAATINGHTTWDEVAGDPDHAVRPLNPFMLESRTPRSGSDPFTNDPILGPTSTMMNRINGHDWNTTENLNGDLEYACTFALPTSVDCSTGGDGCDCQQSSTTNPVCSPQHATTQVRAKAYPGTRQLAVLKGLGAQGVAASICPANQTDASRSDYAYRPAMRAVIERVAGRLATSK